MKIIKKNRPGRVSKERIINVKYSNPDEAVLNLMREYNDVPSGKRPVYFYLYFPDQEKARTAESELINLGFSVECSEPLDGKTEWLCLAEKNMLPNLKELTPVRKELERLTQRLNGKYDGWETEMFPGGNGKN